MKRGDRVWFINRTMPLSHRVEGTVVRFDYAFPDLPGFGAGLAIELDGGNWIRGRHARPRGIEGDHEKRNAAQLLGWVVLTVTTAMAEDGRLAALLEQVRKRMEE